MSRIPPPAPPAPASSVLLAALLVFSLLALACAPGMPAAQIGRPTGYDQLEASDGPPAGFEIAPTEFDPAEVVPRNLLQGPHHVVRSVRLDHRFLYTYVLDSAQGEFEVVGRGLLRKRILETELLADSQPTWLGDSKLYALAVANATAEPIEGALQILRHPLRTVSNLPKGAVAAFKALREMTQMGRTYLEDDYYREFIGLSGQKRDWAERMGVDPYTSNPHMQALLTRQAWLSLAGDMTVTLATLPVPAGGASIAMSVVGATSGMNEQLADVAPEDIRVSTRSWLRDELGMDGEIAERFLEHPWYSPSRQRAIVQALARMQGAKRRDRFIETAALADEPHEAFGFIRLALMFAEYHDRGSPIQEFFTAHDLLMARTAAGDVVLPLYMDFGYWTAEVARAELEITRSLRPDSHTRAPTHTPTGGKLLLVSGQMSPRATQELTTRDWELIDGLEELWLSERDLARYQPADRDAGRILPEFGP